MIFYRRPPKTRAFKMIWNILKNIISLNNYTRKTANYCKKCQLEIPIEHNKIRDLFCNGLDKKNTFHNRVDYWINLGYTNNEMKNKENL